VSGKRKFTADRKNRLLIFHKFSRQITPCIVNSQFLRSYTTLHNNKSKYTNLSENKKFELMLTRCAKAYSSSCPQAVTHRSTNRNRRRVTSFQPKHVTNDAMPPMPVPWRLLVNDIDLLQPESAKKSIKPPILAFRVIQGHWIRR